MAELKQDFAEGGSLISQEGLNDLHELLEAIVTAINAMHTSVGLASTDIAALVAANNALVADITAHVGFATIAVSDVSDVTPGETFGAPEDAYLDEIVALTNAIRTVANTLTTRALTQATVTPTATTPAAHGVTVE
jgi:hypothetical protein